MEIILEKQTATYSSLISSFDICTQSNAERTITNVVTITAGLTNVYTKGEVDTLIGDYARDFVMDIDNIFI